jgi:hypothetical protein
LEIKIFKIVNYYATFIHHGTGITQSVWRRATVRTTEVRFPAGARDFSEHSVETDSGAHPVYNPMATGVKPARCVKLTTDFHAVPRSRMVELYLHSPIYLHRPWRPIGL